MSMPRHIAAKLANALYAMAQANWFEFQRSPKLCALYWRNLKEQKHVYVPDRVTCGLADCWSTYRALAERYPYPAPILLDCEDAACAHAGWLAAQCYAQDRIVIGLVPGKRISHAIGGVERGGYLQPSPVPAGKEPRREANIRIFDPSRAYGMAPTHYDNPVWRYVT